MEEFILRDGEIAFIENGQTSMIMNVNTALELYDKMKARQAKNAEVLERQRKEIRDAVALSALAAVAMSCGSCTKKPAEPELPEVPALLGTVAKKYKAVKHSIDDGDKYSGDFNVIAAEDGKIFASAAEAERTYGLTYQVLSNAMLKSDKLGASITTVCVYPFGRRGEESHHSPRKMKFKKVSYRCLYDKNVDETTRRKRYQHLMDSFKTK